MKITKDKYKEILEIQGISYNENSKWFTVSLDRINEVLTIPVVVKSFYCHDKTGGDCNDLGYKQCVECAIKQKMQ